MDMYSRVKRRKSMRRSTFSMPAHHKAMSKSEQEDDEEEGTEGELLLSMFFFINQKRQKLNEIKSSRSQHLQLITESIFW